MEDKGLSVLQEVLGFVFGVTLHSTGEVTTVGIWEDVVIMPLGSRHGVVIAATGTLLDERTVDFPAALFVVANPTKVAEAGLV